MTYGPPPPRRPFAPPPFAPPSRPAGHRPPPYGPPVGQPPPLTPVTDRSLPSSAADPRPRPAAAPDQARHRSVAWVYYTVIAVLGAFFAVGQGHPAGLVVTALCGAYAVYLFRGGRFVIWIW